jgi:hypothetical protein
MRIITSTMLDMLVTESDPIWIIRIENVIATRRKPANAPERIQLGFRVSLGHSGWEKRSTKDDAT